MKIVVVLTFVLLFFSSASYSSDVHSSSQVRISNLKFYSGSEPVNPSWADIIQVKFESSVVWVPSNACRSDQVAVRKQDDHLVSALHAAYAQGKLVSVQSDTTLVHDGVCVLRTLQY